MRPNELPFVVLRSRLISKKSLSGHIMRFVLLFLNVQHCWPTTHYWMLHDASACTPCFMLLHVVVQSLKPAKIVGYCVRLNVALAELFSTRCNLTRIYN